MLAFPFTLIQAAKQAGMEHPELDREDEFDREAYPHFHVFCEMQLGRPKSDSSHWDNAKVIAGIPAEQIKSVTAQEIIDRGFVF